MSQVLPFQPTQLSGCQLWLDGADTSTVSLTGTTVNTWTDKVASIPFAATNGTGITYSNSLINLASNTFFKNSSSNISVSQTFTIFLVASNNTGTLTGAIYISSSPNAQPGIYIEWPGWAVSPTQYRLLYRSPASGAGGVNVLTAAPGVLPLTMGTFYRNTSGANYELGMAINGSTPTTASDTQSAELGACGEIAFGANYNVSGSSRYLTGSYAEVIIYTGALSLSQRQQNEGYLAWKWGLQGNLPANHPYKNAPPFSQAIPLGIIPITPARLLTASAFSPTQISDCQLWFDAADRNTFTLSGSLISRWRDKSSNAYQVIQTTISNQPSYTNNAQNGLAGIQMATATYLSNVGSAMPNFTTGANTSVFIAARNGSTNTSWNIVNTTWFNSAGADATRRYHFSFNRDNGAGIAAGTTLFANTSLVGQVTSNAVQPSANAIIGFTASSSLTTIHTNGSSNAYSGVTLPNANNTTVFIFGDNRFLTTLAGNIIIFEMIGYNRQITTAERQQIEGYLSWKWNIPLDATQPYSSNPFLPFSFPLFAQPAVGAVFNPRTIASCQLWLDAADTSTLTLSGVNITQWRDKSGNGYNATPTGTIPYTASINKYTTPSWTGSVSTYFRGTGLTNTGTTLTAFSVFNMNSSSYSSARILSLSVPGQTDFNSTLYTAAIERFNTVFNAYRNLASLSGTTATFGVPVFVTSQFNGTTHTFYLNGTGATPVNSSGNFGYTAYNIGSSFGEENLVPLNGTIGEVLLYTSSLTQNQRQQVEGYLAWKWGLQANLPSTHPWKLFPPPPS